MSASDISNINVLTASGQKAVISTVAMGTVGVQITGTWTGTLTSEITIDGVDWAAVSMVPVPSGGAVASVSVNGVWQVNVAGCQSFRLRASAAITGSVQVALQSSSTVSTTAGSGGLSDVNLADVGGTSISLGQKNSDGSIPVVIATDQAVISIDGPDAKGTSPSGNPVQVGGVFNSSPPAPSTGQIEPLQLDAASNVRTADQFAPQAEDNTNGVYAEVIKPLSVATYCPSLFTNRGANNTLNVKASVGNVFSLSCFNTTASVRYVGLYNTATVPVNTNVPIVSFLVPGNAQIVIGQDYFSSSGLNFTTGIAFAISTTMDTLTLASATDQSTSVVFK